MKKYFLGCFLMILSFGVFAGSPEKTLHVDVYVKNVLKSSFTGAIDNNITHEDQVDYSMRLKAENFDFLVNAIFLKSNGNSAKVVFIFKDISTVKSIGKINNMAESVNKDDVEKIVDLEFNKEISIPFKVNKSGNDVSLKVKIIKK